MIDHFIQWVGSLGTWAYLAIFLVVSLESAAFLGFFMPGETLVVLGGFLAWRGALDVRILIVLVAAAAILGDSIGYEMGRRLQKSWLLRYGHRFGMNEARWAKVESFFQRHGGKTVFLARFSAFFRILVPFFAGAARLDYGHFLFFNVLGGTIWAIGSVLIGYLAGESWPIVAQRIGRATLLLAAGVILLAAFVWHRRRR